MSTEFASANFTAGQLNAIVKKLGGEEKTRAFLRGLVEVVWVKLLDIIGTVKTSATTEKFVAKDKFKLKKDGGLCSHLGDNFTAWFLTGEGKIEEPMSEQKLRFGTLLRSSVDGPILEELGGEAKAETTLAAIYDLMSKQPNGGEGTLLANGYGNIFYVRDTGGVLSAVDVDSSDGGWYVNAYSVENACDWPVGARVFSANS